MKNKTLSFGYREQRVLYTHYNTTSTREQSLAVMQMRKLIKLNCSWTSFYVVCSMFPSAFNKREFMSWRRKKKHNKQHKTSFACFSCLFHSFIFNFCTIFKDFVYTILQIWFYKMDFRHVDHPICVFIDWPISSNDIKKNIRKNKKQNIFQLP